MKIDVHAHYTPERFIEPDSGSAGGFLARIRDAGGRLLQGDPAGGFAGRTSQTYSISERLRDMDEQGVDMHVLSISPLLFDFTTDTDTATQVCRLTNDAFAETVAAHPSRFVAIAHLPMQAPQAAASELERTVRDLDFRGAIICSNIGGANLDDAGLTPVYAKAQELDVPLFVHPQHVLAPERLSRYHLGNLIGNPTDTAVAAASLIFGGVLKEFPRLKIYLAHGGGSCPLLRGRWEHGWQVRPEAKIHIQRPPSEYFRLLYFDSLTHSIPALKYLVETAGPERVMLGTDYPADMADAQPVKTIASLPGLSEREKDLIHGGNAQALFKI
jgi:aminocarboxymuconate-semialdehyde decarboxylase